jgi:isoquinoline 1-oxidoreductase beta subunit
VVLDPRAHLTDAYDTLVGMTLNAEDALVSRRAFLVGTVGVLVLSSGVIAQDRRGSPVAFGAWLRIDGDDTVTVLMSQSEMGQGISTTLPLALVDELGGNWSAVRTEWSPYDPAYRHPQYGWMFTGNSESTQTFYPLMRTMGAAAREMLVQAAAARLQVDPESLKVHDGAIRHAASDRSLRFGEVAKAAAQLQVPKTPKLKADSELTMIGRAQPRRDIPSKVDGSAVFGIDVKVPGMAVAAIRRAPSQGGKLLSYDRAGIAARPGVFGMVEIPSGLAVVADHYWTAHQALKEGKLVFEAGPIAGYSTDWQRADHAQRLKTGEFVSKKKIGDPEATLSVASHLFEAVYELQAQAHATMEPMNCTAHVTADRCELWIPTQGMEITYWVAKQATGLPDDRIIINRTLIGGGFGRRLLADFAHIAILVAKEATRPVKVIWSREEDFLYDAYRPPITHAVRACLSADGSVAAMTHKVVSASQMLYVFPRPPIKAEPPWDRPVAPPPAYDTESVEGVIDPVYAIANYSVDQNYVETPLSVSVWRTTGHGPNNFVLESFLDELAHSNGRDPLEYRLMLAANDLRALAVLKAVGEMSGWEKPLQKGHAKGIALGKAFGGYVAQVIEIEARAGGKDIKVRKVWCVIDCGKTLDPGIAASNAEGGVVWGLSALRTEAAFVDGQLQSTNFDGFDPLHLWETPVIETRFIDSGATVGGTGELGPVPTLAAFGNAVFAATGQRIRSLPISRHGMRLV